MIFYFSATGNSRHVAQRLAQATGDSTAAIATCAQQGEHAFTIAPQEAVGIVSPVYFFGLPAIVEDFLRQLSLTGAGYIYFVGTYGSVGGQVGKTVEHILASRGLHVDLLANVRMVDVWTPLFDVSDKLKTARTTSLAEPRIDHVAALVKARATGDHQRHTFPLWASRLLHGLYGHSRKTAHFTVDDSCTGCGACAKRCPVGAIVMDNGKPRWTAARCEACLCCLHHCPAFAIQRGGATRRHGQFRHPGSR